MHLQTGQGRATISVSGNTTSLSTNTILTSLFDETVNTRCRRSDGKVKIREDVSNCAFISKIIPMDPDQREVVEKINDYHKSAGRLPFSKTAVNSMEGRNVTASPARRIVVYVAGILLFHRMSRSFGETG